MESLGDVCKTNNAFIRFVTVLLSSKGTVWFVIFPQFNLP